MGDALHNWAGNVVYATDVLHEPVTVAQLQELIAARPRVRAVGSGHSFNRIADTDGELISVARLDLPIDIDAAARTATVAGGHRYAQVTAALDDAGWAIHNLGSLPHISVAGACATGTHGSGDHNVNLAGAVEAVEFVRADGELVRVVRGDASFGGSVLALGALGVVTRLTLRIEPAFQMRQDVYLDLPVERAAEHIADIMAAAYSVSMFTDFRRPELMNTVWLKRRVGDGLAPAESEWLGARLADEPQHPIPGVDPSAATEQLGHVGPWHERLPHFRPEFTPSFGEELQTEYFLPRAAGGEMLLALQRIAPELRPAVQVCEIRTIAADDAWPSPCRERDTVTAHFTWIDDMSVVLPAVQAIESAFADLDFRPHWAKVFDVPRERFAEIYPLADFRELAAHHDPGRKFGNAFLESYVY